MASISSMISLVVLLLATYCYSVPIVTDDDYTTSGYKFTTGKAMTERESMGFTLPEEYTTVFSTINHKREHAGDKDGSDSDEMTTEYSSIKGDHQKRSSYGETTPEPFEATSVVSKRSLKHESDESESAEKTTQRSMMGAAHQKRHSFDEMTSTPFDATPMMNERSADMELSGEFTTGRSMINEAFPKRDSSDEVTSSPFEATSMMNERSIDMETSGKFTTGRSMINEAFPKRDSSDEVTSSPFEATSMMNERSIDMETSGKFTTGRSVVYQAFPKRDSSDEVTSSPFEATSMINERSVDMETSDDLTTERSYAERGMESDSFTTFESSTQFNNRVGQFGQRESVHMDMTTDFEPTSSGESFSQATGLLHQREGEYLMKGKLETEQPETHYHKTETIVPGKITKTELRQGENQSYTFKGMPVEQQVSSFSEGTTEKNDSKTTYHH